MAFPAVASSSSVSTRLWPYDVFLSFKGISTRSWPYDVFLSFRGSDTRNNFIAHLFNALYQMGIHTYMDDKLERGDEISPALLKAIKESKIAIVVLSENYASSAWCLDELKVILECRENNQQTVLPVFYKILPSDVRYQNKKFGKALAKHKGRYKKEIVQRWKKDLEKVSKLVGFAFTNDRNESKFINEIVQVVSTMVTPTANYPVGIKPHVEDINMLLKIGMRRMVGIFGVGGIENTIIADVINNSIAHQFEGTVWKKLPRIQWRSHVRLWGYHFAVFLAKLEKLASGTGERVKFQEKTLEQEIKMDAVLSDYESPCGCPRMKTRRRCWSNWLKPCAVGGSLCET